MSQDAVRRALVLAYYFPPLGGGGAQRPLKLVRDLVASHPSGWQVEVVTGPGEESDRWSPHDPSLLSEIPPEVVVRRIRGPEIVTTPHDGLRGRAERWLGIDSPWSRWLRDQLVETALAGTKNVDVILATMPPYQTASAAVELSRALDRPWVADLRDPWALDEMTLYPTALHRQLDVRRMGRQLLTAAAVVTTTPEAAFRIARTFPRLADRRVVSITNGFDPADFAGPPPARTDGNFRIVHSGSLHTDLGHYQRRSRRRHRLVGGDVTGTDVLTRSHVFLLEAIRRLAGRNPSLGKTIELHLAGAVSKADLEAARASSIVHVHGYLNHAEAVGLVRSADLLFLPMQKVAHRERATIIPGKTFEYLASQRPILAAVPEGDARDILEEAGTAAICDPDDVDGMATALETEILRWRTGGPYPTVPPDVLGRYERLVLAGRFDELLTAVTD